MLNTKNMLRLFNRSFTPVFFFSIKFNRKQKKWLNKWVHYECPYLELGLGIPDIS